MRLACGRECAGQVTCYPGQLRSELGSQLSSGGLVGLLELGPISSLDSDGDAARMLAG